MKKELVGMVGMMLDRGASLNSCGATGLTALHHAARNNRPEVIKELLARGADSTLLDANGRTPFDHAQRQGNTRPTVMQSTGVASCTWVGSRGRKLTPKKYKNAGYMCCLPCQPPRPLPFTPSVYLRCLARVAFWFCR